MPPRRAEPEALQAYLKWAEGWRAAARRDRFAWAHDIYGMCREDYEDDVDPDAEGADDNGNSSEVYANGCKSNIGPDNQDHIIQEAPDTIESRGA